MRETATATSPGSVRAMTGRSAIVGTVVGDPIDELMAERAKLVWRHDGLGVLPALHRPRAGDMVGCGLAPRYDRHCDQGKPGMRGVADDPHSRTDCHGIARDVRLGRGRAKRASFRSWSPTIRPRTRRTSRPGWTGRPGSTASSGPRTGTWKRCGPVRFWATNICFEGCFPTHQQAERLAARLARLGINCVRMHHMDSYSIWGNSPNKLTIDPGQAGAARLSHRPAQEARSLHEHRTCTSRAGSARQEGFSGRVAAARATTRGSTTSSHE